MNKSKQIQSEIDHIITAAKVMYNSSKMNRTTMKAQQEIRDLGLETYVPKWIMEKGAKADRIIDEIVKAAKQDGTKVVPSYGYTTAYGDGEFVPGQTIPASNLYTLLNTPDVEKSEEITDADTKEFEIEGSPRQITANRIGMHGTAGVTGKIWEKDGKWYGTYFGVTSDGLGFIGDDFELEATNPIEAREEIKEIYYS